MDASTANKVYLYVYDLTQGMAKSLSPMLIGRTIEGIWHTAIVVYGNEYFFGDGICNEAPGTTPFGTPTKKELLGETEIDMELFHEYLSDIKDRFSPFTYNVKSHNCNHFTNECANFLLGSDIPHDILNQAEDLFKTPLGKMVEPMVMQQQDALKQGSNNMFGNDSSGVTTALGGMNLSESSNKTAEKLIECKSMVEMQNLLQQYPGIVVDCWSPTCPPCVKFKPTYAEMANFYGSDKVKFVTVNTKECPEVAMNFMVTSVPAFFIYQNGQCVDQFVGANKAKLTECVKKLKTDVGDTGESTPSSSEPKMVVRLKSDLGFAQFKPWSTQEILFESVGNMAKIGNKIKEVVSTIERDDISDLKTLMDDFKMSGLNSTIIKQLLICLQECQENDIFALFDFLRCCFITNNFAQTVTGEDYEYLDKALARLESLCEGDPSSFSKFIQNAQMTSCQALCNLFKSESSYSSLFEDPEKVNRILRFAGNMVTSVKDKAISAAASVALNIGIAFDKLYLTPLEENKEAEWDQKFSDMATHFALLEEGTTHYCTQATASYPKIENSDALYRLIMSECRLLHCNFKKVEELAGEETFMQNRLRVTQKYPSGQLNDSITDLQKIMSSYLK